MNQEEELYFKVLSKQGREAWTIFKNPMYRGALEIAQNLYKDKAHFVYEAETYEKEESIIKTNTVAIMFPFIRSQVTLLTTQPGMTPIVLPPINTTKFE